MSVGERMRRRESKKGRWGERSGKILKKCREIHNCSASDLSVCPAAKSIKNCWQIKEGCLCTNHKKADCKNCRIYEAHYEEVMSCIRKAQDKDKEAAESLINEYSNFVCQISKRFYLDGGTKEDLLQEGRIGLYLAITRFDNTQSLSFEDYASLSIRNYVLRAVRRSTQIKRKILSQSLSLDENPVVFQSIPCGVNIEDEVIGQLSVIAFQKSWKSILSDLEYKALILRITSATIDEIAGSLEVSKKQIENAIFRARKKISSQLEQPPFSKTPHAVSGTRQFSNANYPEYKKEFCAA